MQPLTLSKEQVNEVKFYTILQEISQDLSTFFLKGASIDLPAETLLSHRQFERLDPDLHPFVKKIHDLVYSQLEGLKQTDKVDPYLERHHLLIPLSHIEGLTKAASDLKSLSPGSWDALGEVPKTTRRILEFVEDFNEQYKGLHKWREEAQELIESLKRETWKYEAGVPTVPKAEAVPAARCGLYQLFLCNDPIIKEYALIALTELLEWDPLHMESAYHLMELQKQLLEEIRAQKSQDLNTSLQRRLIKAYAISVECILLHAAAGHLNAMSDEMKQEHWNGAEELEALNVSKDPEIKFWAKYAIQGIQHIKSDKSMLMNILGRLGLIARAGISIAIAVNKPDEAASVITQAFFDLRSAFTHIEWHANWFEELLVLKKLCRYSVMDPATFRNLSFIFKDKKNVKSSKKLLYGLVSILEYTILNSPSREIREEAIKILLQYYTLDHQGTKDRALETIQKMRASDDAYLKSTAYAINQLLIAGGKLSKEHSMPPLKVEKKHIYENVLKFLLLRLAEIKGGFDAGGHSMITLLCTSEVESVIPPLLKCLIKLCPGFQESDIWGNTPFHLMVRQDHLSTLRYVDSEMDIDIDAQEFEKQYTALHDAVLLQSQEGVEILLELGANPNLQDRQGNTPLHHATLLSPELAETLLKGGSKNNRLNHLGETPLNHAIKHGLKAQIRLLIENKGKIAEDAQGITPLMFAAKVGNIVSMETLVELQGGKISEREALELVRYNKSLSSKKRDDNRFWRFHCQLLEQNDLYAAAFASLQSVSTDRHQFGDTKLMRLAKSKKNTARLKKALKEGADPNVANRFGQTALHTAIIHNNAEAVRLLTHYGANVNRGDINGFTPVHLAAYEGQLGILIRLLDKKGDPNKPNDFGETPFLLACGTLPYRQPVYVKETDSKHQDNIEILKELRKAGAITDAVDPLGNNGLHRAVISGSEQLILWLYHEIPKLMWKKNKQGVIPVESAIHSHRHLDTDAVIVSNLYALHQEMQKKTNNRLTLGNLLVSANEPVAFEALIKDHPELAVHTDSTQMKYSPLHFAAIRGNIDILRIYIKLGIDLNHCDAAGNTAAHLAAYYGNGEFLEILRDHKANLLLKNRDGRIPLHLAATKTRARCIEALKSECALIQVDNRGDTPLHIACRYGRKDVVSRLWKPMLQVNDEGNTPLHEACLHGQDAAMRFLIQKGEDIEARNAFGQTPLMLAAQEGHSQAVEQLLVIGANIWAVDDEGDTVLHKAVFNHHYNVVTTILKSEKQLIATMDGRLVERQNHNGETPLHLVTKKAPRKERTCSLKILAALMNDDSNPKTKNQDGEAFMHTAAYYGRDSLFDLFMNAFPKFKLNSTDLRGNTPLHKAVLGKNPEMVERLCTHRAKLEEKNDEKLTPLLLAVKTGFWEGARILLKHGAKPDQTSGDGKSLFHYILDRKEIDREGYGFLVDAIQTFPKVLLLRDNKKRTPLHILAVRGHHLSLFILRFLPNDLEKNSKFVWTKDADGQTAFSLAEQHHHKKLARQIRTFPPESLGADYKSRSKPLLEK